jgi:hypothetical protein
MHEVQRLLQYPDHRSWNRQSTGRPGAETNVAFRSDETHQFMGWMMGICGEYMEKMFFPDFLGCNRWYIMVDFMGAVKLTIL